MKIVLASVLTSILVFAGVVSAKSELNTTQLRAAAYLLKKSDQKKFKTESLVEHVPPGCHDPVTPPVPDSQCVAFVAGSYPTSDERIRAARACAGVYNLQCVQFAAGSYPTFSEREAAARSCSGVHDIACAEYVAGSYPTTSERTQAVEACRYANVDCVRQVAGSYPTFSERVEAARACGGN